MSKKIEIQTEELVLKLLSDEYELVDVDYVRENQDMYLRILIDKKGSMDIEDCEKLSRIIGEKLDEEDFIKDSYYLEISSPGLDRTLKKEKDFIREKGKKVEVKLYKALEGEKQKEFIATLEGLDEDKKIILDRDGKIIKLDPKSIAKINLYLEF